MTYNYTHKRIPKEEWEWLLNQVILRYGGVNPTARMWAERYGGSPGSAQRSLFRWTSGAVEEISLETFDKFWELS